MASRLCKPTWLLAEVGHGAAAVQESLPNPALVGGGISRLYDGPEAALKKVSFYEQAERA